MTTTGFPQPRPSIDPGRAAALRAEFDQAFARPATGDDAPRIDVLTLRLDQELYAVRLSEVAQMTARPVLTPVPATAAALIGLAAPRGPVVAAYDLGALLGGTRGEPRWLIVPAALPSIGLTFEHFEGHRKILTDKTSGSAEGDPDVSSSPSADGRLLSLSVVIDAVRALDHTPSPRLGEAQ